MAKRFFFVPQPISNKRPFTSEGALILGEEARSGAARKGKLILGFAGTKVQLGIKVQLLAHE